MTLVKLEIKNLSKLTALATRYPAASERHVGAAIKRSLVRIFGEEKKEAPVGVSAQLRDRWELVTARFAGSLTSGVNYAKGVHDGRGPHYVSPAALAPWAAKKGLNPYAVSKSIERKGTKANPFLQRAVDNTAKAVENEFAVAIDAILTDVTR